MSTRGAGKSAGNHEAGKTAPRPEIDPSARIGGELEELERIGNVPRPQIWHRGGRNQVCSLLPFQQECDKPIEALQCFT